MALLGLLSLAQIWFVPGYLLLYLTRDISRLDKVFLAFPLSAVVNFFLVYVLVLFGAYSQPSIIAIFIVETATLAFLVWKTPKPSASAKQTINIKMGAGIDFTYAVFALFVLFQASQFFNQLGTVFTQGDAVSSWNPWGVSWYNGVIPHGLAWYPQLLPALYSLSYQFMANSQIELFAKTAVSFYPLVAFAMFARMASLIPSNKKIILWSGIIFFLLVRRLWGGESAVNGYADFPLAFFCVSIMYVFLLKATEQNRGVAAVSIALPAVIVGVAIGAALMKHSGIFLGMLIPFAWLLHFRHGRDFFAHLKQSIAIGTAIALACATWYLYQYWRISTGAEQSNLQQLSSIIQMTWYESIAYGFKSITHKLSWLWVVLFLASLLHRKVRWLALCVVMPFFLLWAAFVPYDYRNLAIIFPLLSLAMAYGWAELARLIGRILPLHISAITQRGLVLATGIALAVALANPKFNDELLTLSNTAKSQIGDPEINSRLSAYFEFHRESALVAASYQEMSKIPVLDKRYRPFSCGNDYGKQSAQVATILLELSDPDIHYLLLQHWCDVRVLEYFASQPGKYREIFRRNGAVFYEIIAR